jgi:L-amino acid N-acyltransferase YncA
MLFMPIKLRDAFLFAIAEERCIASSTSFWEMVAAFLFSSNQGSTKTHANHLFRKPMVFAELHTSTSLK